MLELPERHHYEVARGQRRKTAPLPQKYPQRIESWPRRVRRTQLLATMGSERPGGEPAYRDQDPGNETWRTHKRSGLQNCGLNYAY